MGDHHHDEFQEKIHEIIAYFLFHLYLVCIHKTSIFDKNIYE